MVVGAGMKPVILSNISGILMNLLLLLFISTFEITKNQ